MRPGGGVEAHPCPAPRGLTAHLREGQGHTCEPVSGAGVGDWRPVPLSTWTHFVPSPHSSRLWEVELSVEDDTERSTDGPGTGWDGPEKGGYNTPGVSCLCSAQLRQHRVSPQAWYPGLSDKRGRRSGLHFLGARALGAARPMILSPGGLSAPAGPGAAGSSRLPQCAPWSHGRDSGLESIHSCCTAILHCTGPGMDHCLSFVMQLAMHVYCRQSPWYQL